MLTIMKFNLVNAGVFLGMTASWFQLYFSSAVIQSFKAA